MLIMYSSHATSFFMFWFWILAIILLTNTITGWSKLEADIGNIDILIGLYSL